MEDILLIIAVIIILILFFALIIGAQIGIIYLIVKVIKKAWKD